MFTEEQTDSIIEMMQRDLEDAMKRRDGTSLIRHKRKLVDLSGRFKLWEDMPIRYKFNGEHSKFVT